MSPLGSTWISSISIWLIWFLVLIVYHRHFIRRIRFRSPVVIASLGNKAQQLPKSPSVIPPESIPTREKRSPEYLARAKGTLDGLIKEGEELVHRMQRGAFHTGQLGQEVRPWLDKTEHDVWEVIPEHGNALTSKQASVKEIFTDEERLRYGGWNRNAAALRVSVDRRLVRLREIRSRIQVPDMGDS